MTDIANRYFVSPKTVERILKSYTYEANPYTYQLPECLLVDEFKERKIVIQNFALFLVIDKLGKSLIF